MVSPDIDELKAKQLCYRCVGEDYLRAEIQRDGQRHHCSYCDRRGNSYSIEDLANRIEKVFEQHYRRTSDQPSSWQLSMLGDRESNYEWERDGEPVVEAIANAADVPEQAAEDIQAILDDQFEDFDSAAVGEETEFSSESYYEEKGTSDQAWQEEWSTFERSLKTEARFFSRTAAAVLASVFGGIDTMSATDGRPLVLEAGRGTALSAIYRARVFQSDDDKLEAALCRPDQHLGSPPASLASAGRMNARGISVFYGANEANVAIAEVRPPVGSRVAVARFTILRQLRLLDLSALGAVTESGSVFDPTLAGRLERAMFLRSLSERITRPVMPDDEAFDYLPTQAIADFLATENEPLLDGIVFPSVQSAGNALNVVLFHKAARIDSIDIPEGTDIKASLGRWTEDGWAGDYSVIEEVPPVEPQPSIETPALSRLAFDSWTDPDPDVREAMLRVDPRSIEVHAVRKIQVDSDSQVVTRHRWEKRSPEF